MNMTTKKQVNAAINWYPIYDSGKPPLQKTAREALKEALTKIACDCCDENNEGDFEKNRPVN
ncbi:hypothetical protein KCE64_005146 [Salmonella enterica subsp. enterica serovar Hvittingfoss]|nr:hypothetical protein [Salmonella enterica subsp. enterica serovar Hvittingfoss]EHL2852612.1 hypothetical protein [Salmonella enterica subsp. enterica serovar Hvittingfoss]